MTRERRPGLFAGRSGLARLVVLALVPVLYVGIAAGPASAAILYSEPKTAVIKKSQVGPANDVNCSIVGFYEVNTDNPFPIIKIRGSCSAQVLFGRSDLQITTDGGSCNFTSDVEHGIEGGVWDMIMTITTPLDQIAYNAGGPSACNVVGGDARFFNEDCTNDISGSNCVGVTASFTWAMGSPPVPQAGPAPGTCVHGTVSAPAPVGAVDSRTWAEGVQNAADGGAHVTLLGGGNYGPNWGIDWRQNYQGSITGSTGPGQWFMYVVTSGNVGGYPSYYARAAHVWLGSAAVDRAIVQKGSSSGVSVVSTWAPTGIYAGGYPYHNNVGAPGTATIIGTGWYYSETGIQDFASYPVGSTPPAGPLGISDSGQCRFYWGTKIAETTDTTDNPLGPVAAGSTTPTGPPVVGDPTPPASDGSCAGFSWTNPSTWAGAGICAVVAALVGIKGVLDSILGVIGGLATAIAAAIGTAIADAFEAVLGLLGDLLSTLFVPDTAHMKTKVNAVKASWDDTAPGQIIATVTGLPSKFTAPSSAGCDGPALPLTFGMGSGSTTLHPLSTCSAGMARVATIVKTAMQVGVWLGAILLAFRILAGSLGYQVAIGKGDDA